MGSREGAPEINEMGNNTAESEKILHIETQFPRRHEVVHDVAKARRSKVKPHVILGEEFSKRFENLWVEETGNERSEERFFLPDLPQRIFLKRTHDADPVSEMDDVAFKGSGFAAALFPGKMMETNNLCKRCKRFKVLEQHIAHKSVVMRIAKLKVKSVKTLQ